MKIISYLPLLLIGNYLFAQGSNPNTFAFPSVNNNFLGKSGPGGPEVSVDFYTGAAQASVPICTLASRELQIPISLNYVDGRGIKLQEYASQVGLGWQLNAGGSITRVVRGFPDDQENGYLGTGTKPAGVLSAGQQWGQLITSSYNNKSSLTSSQQTALWGWGSNPSSIAIPTADSEPDIFYVKTPFFSFQFVFNASGVPVFSSSNGYKIIPTKIDNSGDYFNSSFEVIDDQGNQFYFGSSSLSRETSSDSLYNVPYIFLSTWYLDKIVTFNSKDNITLTYQAATTNDTTYNYSYSEASAGGENVTTLNSGKTIIYQPKFISTIVSTLGEVDFNYAFNTRQDDHNVPYLASIVTKGYNPQSYSNSIVLQIYNFNYGYFGSPSTDPNILRLELNSVSVTGNNTPTINLASFGYSTTNNLPNRTWLVYDFWGYCNSITNPPVSDYTYLATLVESPSAVFAQADILNSITTAQGGTWSITYEGNVIPGSQIGGLRVNKIAHITSGQNLYKTYQYVDINSNNSGQINSTLYNNTSFNVSGVNLTLTGSPYIINDMDGTFIGYSWVKETDQNGGFTLYNFSNYNDGVDADGIPNSDGNTITYTSGFAFVVSPINVSFKRGLLLSSSVYNSSSVLLTQTTNTYSPQNASSNDAIGIGVWNFSAATHNYSGSTANYSVYWTPIENYRLTKTITKVFDQVTAANSITTTTQYAYDKLSDPLNNNRLVDSISTTDSKGLSHVQTIYRGVDVAKTGSAAIPMLTTPETTTINTMNANNKTNAVIHSIDNRNGTINQVHNSYSSVPYGSGTKIFLGNSASYSSDPINTGNTLLNQKTYYYDAGSSDLISYNNLAGINTSVNFGYNSSLPTIKAVNASSTVAYSNQPQTQSGSIVIPPNSYGSYTVNFTTFSTGTITVAMPPGSYLAGSVTCFFSYYLSGPTSGSGNLCNSSVSGYTCSAPNTFSFTNAPAGTYTLSVSALTNSATSNVTINYTYTGFQIVATPTTEFFFEGFEENSGATSGSAHTGNMYYNTNYTVPYTPPNSRRYLIQWWNLSAGVWNFNQQTYTQNMSITGPVDDVRVFPSDALITTYTYNPLVGKTSMTNPSGRTETYKYDGLNRIQTVRDQDNNILKQFDYEYGYANNVILNAVNSTSVSYTLTYNNISTGVNYNFNLSANSTCTVGNVPAGTYNVIMTPSSYSSGTPISYSFNGSVQTYYAAVEFGSVTVSGTVSMIFSYPPVQSVTVQNSSTETCTITFKNLSTNMTTNFTSVSNGLVVNVGTVPAGNYNITISPNAPSKTKPNIYTVYSSSQNYYAAVTFGNVAVNTTCPIVIQQNLP